MANISRARQRANEAGVVVSPISGTAHTLSVIDRNCVLAFSAATPITATLPNNLPAGYDCWLLQDGAGAVTAAPAAGATAVSPGNPLSTATQYASLYCLVIANADGVSAIWDITGLGGAGGGGGGGGTVTSVGLVAPAEFTVSGSPVTTNGALTFAKAAQVPHTVWAGPSAGGNAAPTFRTLQMADLPPIDSGNVSNLGTFATQNYATPPPIGGTTPAPLTGTQVLATSFFDAPNGTVASPGYQFAPGLGWYSDGVNILGAVGGAVALSFSANVANVEGAAAQTLVLHRTDAALASGDTVGVVSATGPNDSGTNKTWGSMNVYARIATSGGETGNIFFTTQHGGANTTDFTMDSGSFYVGTATSGKLVIDNLGKLYGVNLTVADPAAASNPTATISAANSANGANLKLIGNGATTPSKSIRSLSGQLQVVNDAYTVAILTLTDAGNLTVPGTMTAAGYGGAGWTSSLASPPPIGGTTPAAGTFSPLTATAAAGASLIVSRSTATLTAPQSVLGNLNYVGNNSAGSSFTWARVQGLGQVPTAGSEEGALYFQTLKPNLSLSTDFSIDNGVLYGGAPGGALKLADSAGNIFGVTINAANGNVGAPSLGFTNFPNFGFYTDGVALYSSIGGTNGFNINVGGASVVRAGAASVFTMRRSETTLPNSSALGQIQGTGWNSDGSVNRTWAVVSFTARVSTTGSEEGSLSFSTFHDGASTIDYTIDKGVLYYGPFAGGVAVLGQGGGIVGIPASPYIRIAPITGFSQLIGDTKSYLMLTPAGTLAAGTVIMPANPIDGHEVSISSTQTITTLTIQASAGQTISSAGMITTIGPGVYPAWKYAVGVSNWYRVR